MDLNRVHRTMKNLEKNNMQPFFCETKQEALELVKNLLKKRDTVSHGGSVTLEQTGILDLLSCGDYNYLDRSKKGLSREEIEEIYRKSYFADVYLTSSNAVTENGELYNVDGNSNRVSAILYGPKSIIVVCGYNKIVKNLEEAVNRVKTIAAPQNTIRLQIDTYCSQKGKCLSLDKDKSPELCAGCHSDSRICCNYVVSAHQRQKNRIKVILIGEKYGY